MKTFTLLLAGLALAVPAASPTQAAPPAAASYHLVKTIPVTETTTTGWDYLTLDSQARRLYVSRGTHVQVFDADTGAVVGDIAGTNGVHGIAVAPKAGRGFTSNGRDNTVTVFDTKTLKTLGTVAVGTRPDAIIYDPASGCVFTMNGGSNDSTAIDAATMKVVGTIALGGRPEFAASDGAGHVYVNLEDKSQMVQVDSKARTVLAHWSLSPGEGPSGLAIDAVHHRLFSVCDNKQMVVLDTDTGKVVATPAIGNGPDACAFDPSTGMAFSTNGEDGTVTLVHEDSPTVFTVVSTVPTQSGARTCAIDTKTHRLYTVTAKAVAPAPGSAPTRRRSYAPGSFVVLVYGP